MSEYFTHDYNARNDLKLKKLFRQYGLEGIGLYWCMVEMLYENGGRIPSESTPDIAFDLRTDESIIDSLIDDYGLFERENGYIASHGVTERIAKRENISKARSEASNRRWKSEKMQTNCKDNANALQTECKSNAIKENKIKENKNKENNIYIVEIINYLNQKAGTKYRDNTPKTVTLINARMKEGFTVDDFYTVINNKCAEWLNDSKMRRYLRPETLFGTKFESYLNSSQPSQTDNTFKDYFKRYEV